MSTQNKFAVAALAGLMSLGVMSMGVAAHASEHEKAASGEHAVEKHGCKGQNSCKGNGGCKTDKNACKGQNECKGQGGCATNTDKK
jgi:hypothetical protein